MSYLNSDSNDVTEENLANSKTYYGWGYWSDYFFYFKQSHPLCSIFLAHPLNPLSSMERVTILLASTFITFYFVASSATSCELVGTNHFFERTLDTGTPRDWMVGRPAFGKSFVAKVYIYTYIWSFTSALLLHFSLLHSRLQI